MITAVIPMKLQRLAKNRLSDVLGEKERSTLVRSMFCDVLKALHDSRNIEKSFVVTPDPSLAALAAEHQVGYIPETAPYGLNRAVSTAARHVEGLGGDAMLILPGDVPLITAREIDELVLSCGRRFCGIVPAHDGVGTNALFLRPPRAMTSVFGRNSFEGHLDIAHFSGLEPTVCRLDGIGRDIDTPEDLEFLLPRVAGRPEYDCLSDQFSRSLADTTHA